jgi:peptidoglycan/LPS O-acetylase OafA/YrhL
MPEIDVLRGVAVLMVVAYHGLLWTYGTAAYTGFWRIIPLVVKPGWLGVELFFVLSGFLITGILLDQRGKEGYFSRFYMRRALRILPPLLLTLFLLPLVFPMSWLGELAGLLFFSNFAFVWGISGVYVVLWSLAVEEHFYLVWPAVVRKLSARQVRRVAAMVACASPLLRLLSFSLGHAEGLYYETWFVLDGLAMGAWLAADLRIHVDDRRRLARNVGGTAAAGVALLLAGAPFGLLTRNGPVGAALQYTPFCLLFAATLGGAILVATGPRRSLARNRVLEFFGYISYGLYLLHLWAFAVYTQLVTRFLPSWSPWIASLRNVLLAFVIGTTLAVSLSYLSRRFYEDPVLRLKSRVGIEREPTADPQPSPG